MRGWLPWLFVLAAAAAIVAYVARDDAPAVADGPFIRSPAKQLTDVDAAEAATTRAVKAVRGGFLAHLAARDMSAVAAALAPDFEARIADPKTGAKIDDDDLEIRRTSATDTRLDRDATVTLLGSLVGSWAAIERTAWRVFRAEVSAETPMWTRQEVHLILAGQEADGTKVSWYATVTAEIVTVDGSLRLRRLAVADSTWVRGKLRGFADLSRLVGFDWNLSEVDRANVQGMIDLREMVATGGLTALDYNRDGFMDVLASHQAVGSVLFENDGTGGFVKRTLPLIADKADAGKFYLWVDLDNDGAEELVSTKPALYTFASGAMTAVDEGLQFVLPEGMTAPDFEGVTVCDVNGDDLLDLIFAGYSHADSAKAFNNVDSHAGVPNLLFINKGGLRVEEEGARRGVAETRYSFVAECFDFDSDGDVDVFFGNDYGPNEFYDNDGDGRFTADPQHTLRTGTSFSMGVSIADYDNDGTKAISISNMYSHSGNRIVPLTSGLSGHMQGVLSRLAAGNTFYELDGGKLKEVAHDRGVDMADWAWGNIFFDFDNDGDKDLYVVNGYTTHADPTAPDF